jgi:hypothetical protein
MEHNVPRRLLALVRRGTVDQLATLLDGGSSDREEASRHVNTAFEGVTAMVRPMLTWRGWHSNVTCRSQLTTRMRRRSDGGGGCAACGHGARARGGRCTVHSSPHYDEDGTKKNARLLHTHAHAHALPLRLACKY